MRVKTLMRNVVGSTEPTERLATAAARLGSHAEAALVAVERGRVVGVLTEVDVRVAGASTVPALARYEWPFLVARLSVADAMQRDPVVVGPDATVGDVARALGARVRRTAVVMDGPDLVGIVTARDLVGALVERLEVVSPPGFTRIVVALGVPTSAYGRRGLRTPLDTALSIARRHDATLTIVHVMPWLSARIAEGLPAGVEADFHRARLCAAREALWQLVPLEAMRSVRLDFRTGDVASGIVGAATDIGAELIVIGGRPRSSLVHATTHRAPCPVLVA